MSSKGLSHEQLDAVFSPTDIRKLLNSSIPFNVRKAMNKVRGWKDYVWEFGQVFGIFFMMISTAHKLKSEQITKEGITREAVLRLYQVCVSQLKPSQRLHLGCTTTLPDHSTIGGYVFGRVLQLHNIVHYTLRLLPPPTTNQTDLEEYFL